MWAALPAKTCQKNPWWQHDQLTYNPSSAPDQGKVPGQSQYLSRWTTTSCITAWVAYQLEGPLCPSPINWPAGSHWTKGGQQGQKAGQGGAKEDFQVSHNIQKGQQL